MKGYLRDFLRQLGTLSVILPLIGLGALSVGFAATDQPAPAVLPLAYFYDGGLHLIFFVGSETGQPIPGVSLSVLLSPNLFPPSALVYRGGASTGSDGTARLLAPLPEANYSITWYANNSAGSLSQSYVIHQGPIGTIEESDVDLSSAMVGFLSTGGGLFVFAVGPGGAPPSGYSAFYRLYNNSRPPCFSSNSSCGNWTHLGTWDGYYHTFPLSFPSDLSANPALIAEVEIVAANGSIVASTSPPGTAGGGFLLGDFPASAGPTNQATRLVSFITVVLTTYVGFAAVLIAFSRYGRDRVSRVLESVLWRPVTQTGLLLERYGSTVVAMALMNGLAILLLYTGLDAFWKVALPPDFMAVVFGATVATAAALIGVVLLASRIVRSVGPLVGAGIGLLVVFFVLWTSVLSFFSGSGTGPGSLAASIAMVNPALLPALAINALTNGSFAAGALAEVSVTASPASVIETGTLWAVVPILIAGTLARFRD